jgi:hypothetical protein
MRTGSLVAVLTFVTTLVGCTSAPTIGDGGTDAGETLEGRPCSLDPSAEPMLKTSAAGIVQRCSDGWTQAENDGRPCLTPDECAGAGLVCVPTNGWVAWDTKCREPCQPQACSSGTCTACTDGSQSYCVKGSSTPVTCKTPVPEVDGNGRSCTVEGSPYPCTATVQCCSHRLGAKATCYQPLSNGSPVGSAHCDYHCKTNADCDDIYGSTTGYCCLDVLSTKYRALGTAQGTKTCATKQYDSRCTRTPTGGGTDAGGGSKCGNCGTYGSFGSCCGGAFCAGECIGSPCC